MSVYAAYCNRVRNGARTEEKNMEKFVAGLALGAMLGALLVANSNKTRALVKKSQEELREKVDNYIDEKLSSMESGEEENGAKSLSKKK